MEDQNSNRPLYDYTSKLRLTLRAWPLITAATVGLCYLTQTVAKWFGIELPDQANIELVKRYAGWNRTFILLCAQVIILMPAIEELIFRYLLFKLPTKLITYHLSLIPYPYPMPAILRRFTPPLNDNVLFKNRVIASRFANRRGNRSEVPSAYHTCDSHGRFAPSE